MTPVRSFPPVSDRDARVLILGSMPGKASLEAGQYYAHPRNAFWAILSELLDIPGDAPYEQRMSALRAQRISLWDVLRSCLRASSLDADIDESSIVPNDFNGFFSRHVGVAHVFFNGSKAEQAYRRHVQPGLDPQRARILVCRRLPSTSPAHASLGFQEKLAAWRCVIEPAKPSPFS